MQIAIAIASTGRPQILREALVRLERQTIAPARIVVVGAGPADAPEGVLPAGAEFAVAEKGSATQRNHALDMLRGSADVIAFIDDDYIAARDFIAGVKRLFTDHPDVVAASGLLLADGFRSAGISMQEADALIAAFEAAPQPAPVLIDDTGTYGCNMVMRIAAAPQARFDENLPLYAWLEDTDFSAQFARVGRVVRSNHFAGVHLGVKSGRVPGVRLGYSQVANPLYLAKKGTMAKGTAAKIALRNILANAARSFTPEPWVDRAGRLRGNLLALADILRARSHPRRVLDI